jgi:hypothetical protein
MVQVRLLRRNEANSRPIATTAPITAGGITTIDPFYSPFFYNKEIATKNNRK